MRIIRWIGCDKSVWDDSITIDGKVKDRAGYEQQNVEALPFREDRAIFPISLLKEVARVRQERTRKPADHGRNKTVGFYPLTGITYCCHREQLAQAKSNYKFRSMLSGQFGNGILRYRHKPGVKCGITNRYSSSRFMLGCLSR